MALGANVVWEVQTGSGASGDDNNGGGFDAVSGTPGTDYTQGAGQTRRTWLSAGGTHTNDLNITNASPSVMSSASYSFVAADVGNVINLTGGTNVTAGRYRIASVSGGNATLDRNAMTGAPSANASGYLGGALSTVQAGLSAIDVEGQKLYIKAGSGYTITSGLTFPNFGAVNTATRVIGYTSTRTDEGQATITVSGASITAMNVNRLGWIFENLDINCASQSGSAGIVQSNYYQAYNNVKVRNAAAIGFNTGGYGWSVYNGCVAESNGTSGFSSTGQGILFQNCWAKNNTGTGFNWLSGECHISYCLATGNGGSGISLGSSPFSVDHCTIHGNTLDGITTTSDYETITNCISNCIITNNGDYGMDMAYNTAENLKTVRNIAFFNNTSGARESAWTGTIDGQVTLTTLPYTNAGAGDFTLNNTAGGGAACRNVGDNSTDLGAYQHEDAGEEIIHVESSTNVVPGYWRSVPYRT